MSKFSDLVQRILLGKSLPSFVRSLCEDVGWQVDKQTKDACYFRVHRDGLWPTGCQLFAVVETNHALILLATSLACLPDAQLPAQRRKELLAPVSSDHPWKWDTDSKNGDAMFTLSHRILKNGLTPAEFKETCEAMIDEVDRFNARLRKDAEVGASVLPWFWSISA